MAKTMDDRLVRAVTVIFKDPADSAYRVVPHAGRVGCRQLSYPGPRRGGGGAYGSGGGGGGSWCSGGGAAIGDPANENGSSPCTIEGVRK